MSGRNPLPGLASALVEACQNKEFHSSVYKYILRQYTHFVENPHPAWHMASDELEDLTEWKLEFIGPPDTPYENGRFKVLVTFPSLYPIKPPIIRFVTPIYHPNVGEDGKICVYALSTNIYYRPCLTMVSILQDVLDVIREPNTDYYLNFLAAQSYQFDRLAYEKIATDCTRLYAMGNDIKQASALVEFFPLSKSSPPNLSPKAELAFQYKQISTSILDWETFNPEDQLILSDAFRHGQDLVEISDGLLHFGKASLATVSGAICQVRREPSQSEQFQLQRPLVALPGLLFRELDPIINQFLSDNVKTDRLTIIRAILEEGRAKNLQSKAEALIQIFEEEIDKSRKSIGLACVWLYTCSSFLSKSINRYLRRRDFEAVGRLAPFCKALYQGFEENPRSVDSLLVFRGERLEPDELVAYRSAVQTRCYQWIGFTSTSTSRKVGEIFRRNALFIIQLEKRYNGGRALDTRHLSAFFLEDEVLLRSGTEFFVHRYEPDGPDVHVFYITAYI